VLTLIEHGRYRHHLLKDSRCLDWATSAINTKEVLRPEEQSRGVLEVGAVSGQDQQGFVEYGDLAVLKLLGSRLNEVDLAIENIEDELLVRCHNRCQGWGEGRNPTSILDENGNLLCGSSRSYFEAKVR
jgi:hypothetical protein